MPDITYFKRYRMELRFRRTLPLPHLPPGYNWLPWSDDLLDIHAEVKRLCFVGEPDSIVFPNLGSASGCRLLMRAIRDSHGFCPEATWLITSRGGCVGTIQGLVDDRRQGAIQNVGVIPGYRGIGLGRALLIKALHGFLAVGADRVYLEVTAANGPAVRLYRDLGFRPIRTLYRGVPQPISDATGIGAGI
jgi:ribosomal protein S18 acetylase RimI-like enzyme